MIERGRSEITGKLLAAYLEGEVTRSEAAAVEAELADSAICRRRLESLRRIRASLSTPFPEFDAVDLVTGLHLAANDKRSVQRWGSNFWNWQVSTASAIAAAACVIGIAISLRGSWLGASQHAAVDAPSGVDENSEFRPKGPGSSPAERGKWVGISVYRLGVDGNAEKLNGRFLSGDGLLFAYDNLGPEPFEYLMVFAVDARGKVYWYYPAYEREGANPSSVALLKGKSAVELGETIRHFYAAGPLELHALFSDEPLRVLEVEAWLSRSRSTKSAVPWPRASDQVTKLVVDSSPLPTTPKPN